MPEVVVERIEPEVRDRIATALTRGRAELVERWEQRHRDEPLLADPVMRDLGDWKVYRDAYLRPLVQTLSLGIREASSDHLHVYAYERVRFVESAALHNGGRAQLRATLRADAEDAIGLLDGKDAEAMRELLEAVHAPIVDGGGAGAAARTVRMMMVGDCLFTEVLPFLAHEARAVGLEIETDHLYFSAWGGKELSPDEMLLALKRKRYDMIGLSFLTFEGIPPYVALLSETGRLSAQERSRRVNQIEAVIRGYIAGIREATNIPVVLHGTCGLPLTRVRQAISAMPPISRARAKTVNLLNNRLRDLAENTENVIFLDEEEAVASVGTRAASRPIIPWSISHGAVFHPSALGRILAQPYLNVIGAHERLVRCKVVLVDFDNTLWRGVMAEGEVEHDLTAQRLLRDLKDAGILLVSLSKNDPESIRWDEMELAPEDFVLHKVGWNLKSQSIEEAVHQLDLSADSFVLLDDNPVERELVTSQLQDVVALDPTEPRTWEQLRLMLDFPNTRATEEAARRTEMYREAAARRDALSGGADYAGMMRTLDLRVEFGPAREEDIDRVHELVERTNQFNTTTIRRTRAEIAALLNDPSRHIFVGTLADKFGKLGIVGLTVVITEGDALTFESVIMSCRAMGFGFETVLLRGAMDALSSARTAIGRYVPTDRNRPCASLFEESGFTAISSTEWTLETRGGSAPEIPDWLLVSGR